MIRHLQGDCRDVLPTLAADSVHCVVTSPPYYGLRDYGVTGQIGLEATPDEWIATLVAVFRELKRILRDDGCAFVNCGDAYRDKQLLLMPARLALALQADGWWVRSDIIWSKPNPMPESCTDRPTSAHEHVFLLTKSARYFYDADAVREPHEMGANSHGWGTQEQPRNPKGSDGTSHPGFGIRAGGREYNPAGRSCRNVWSIATESFSAAHFATYPTALVERCIRAGTSERGCCANCGKPWVRVAEREIVPLQATNNARSCDQNNRGAMPRANTQTTTTGWAAGCKCEAPTRPCVVLDPFGGSGTTGLVASRLQRDAVLIDLSPSYVEMAETRIVADAPLFAWADAQPTMLEAAE